ncbi:MAG: tetratricopeptide repeat protein [Planctomycetota bacterium]|jgi:tetratricopeptide (TPR) repeat protein/serine/threonine protein kinase
MSYETNPGRIRQIYELALKKTGSERAAFLDRICGDAGEVREQVEALLAAHEEVGDFLAEPTGGSAEPAAETPKDPAPDHAPSGEAAGDVVDRYKLLQEIGEGGMGTVWMAEQFEPVRRKVAFKIIKLGMDTKQVVVRFEAERQALALMDHPGIAKVLDGGMTENGRPYFVMELVKGIPITEFCDEARLGIRERLELFVQVCQAVQHAHQKGIIHRDLKPSNVLVTLHDGTPMPKVIDFGIAKATNQELTQKTLFTEYQQILGTPEYMAPEQASLSALDVDTRADVYSLGVLLYELLTGTKPFDLKTLLSRGYEEVLRTIREEDPPKPSTRASGTDEDTGKISVARQLGEGQLGKALRGDLDWIIVKSMEKDRTRRYETANGLAADIRRHLKDEPVAASPPSRGYRLRKFVRRNRLQVVAATVVMVAMLAGIVGTSWGLVEASRSRTSRLERELEKEQRAASDTARFGRNAEAVTALLDQCENALRARDPGKAGIALDAARKRAAEGGADEETERTGRLAAELAVLRDLDDIDQFRWTWSENKFPKPEVVAARVRTALARFGVEPGSVSLDEAVARVNASVIRERIVAALDRSLRQENATGARAVLRRVDADAYRDLVRDAILANDQARLVELANREEALAQPSGFAAFLGTNQAIGPQRRRELLLAAVTRWPGDVDLLMALGTVSYAYPTDPEKSAIERMRWFQAALAADGKNTAAYNDLGGALANRGWADEAEAYFRKAIAIDPTQAMAHANLGNGLLNRGRVDEAIDCFKTALEHLPNAAYIHCNMGRAMRAKGRLDAAIESFRIAVACDLRSMDAHGSLASALAEAGRPEEAIAQFRKCIELDPKDPRNHFGIGLVLAGAGRAGEAIDWFKNALEVDPKYVEARGELGKALLANGRADEAVASGRKGVELDPKSANARFWLAWAYIHQGRLNVALPCLRKTIELDPGHVYAQYCVACILSRFAAGEGPRDRAERARMRQEALELLRLVLASYTKRLESGNPTERAAARDELRHLRQDPDLATIREAAALARLPAEERKAFGRFWADAAALHDKAKAKAGEEDPAPEAVSAKDEGGRAIAFLEETLERQKAKLGPDHPDTCQAMHSLALAYQNAGKLDKALPLLESVVELVTAEFGPDHPNTVGATQNLAVAYWRGGRLDKSIPLFEKLLKHHEAAHGRQHLNTLSVVANLGVNYRDAGRLADAIPLLDEARRAAKEHSQLAWVTGELHAAYDIAFKTWLGLADPALAAKRWPVLIRSLETEAGADHAATLMAMNNLGYALARSRQFADAEAMLKKTIEREVRVLGEGHLMLLQTRTNLGEMYQLQERHAEAEKLLRQCLAEREKKEPNSFRLASTQSMLGRVLAEQKKFAEAEPLLLAGYKGLKENAGKTPDWGKYYLPDTLEWLAQLYEDWGKKDEAAKWRSARSAK